MKAIYADDLLIVRVDDTGKVETTNKEELLIFFQQKADTNAQPLSEEATFHYAIPSEYHAMVV